MAPNCVILCYMGAEYQGKKKSTGIWYEVLEEVLGQGQNKKWRYKRKVWKQVEFVKMTGLGQVNNGFSYFITVTELACVKINMKTFSTLKNRNKMIEI